MDPRIFIDDYGVQRLRNTEFVLPIVVGTIAFSLGKKATEFQSHRWTVYVRGPNNEDLSHIIPRVQFDLHHTFSNANRIVDVQPYEVTEHGWGEFEIVVHIYLTPDSGENEVVLYHKLKLYEDGEQPGSKQDPKRPVITETYEELVFSEPRLDFYSRVAQHRPMPLATPSQLTPYFAPKSDAEELELLRSCRAKVAALSAELRRELMPAMAGAPGVMPGMPGIP